MVGTALRRTAGEAVHVDRAFAHPTELLALFSIRRVPRRPRERDRVAYIGKSGDIGERALEAQAEARVRHGAVAPQVAVPAVVLLVDVERRHARIEHVEPLLALAAADDL